MAKRLANHDVVIGPAIRDLASVRHFYNGKFDKIDSIENSNSREDFKNFGNFIEKFVLKGELDKIYNSQDYDQLNILPFEKSKVKK